VDSLSAAIAQACPDGVDAVFENVGGIILDAVIAALQCLRPYRLVRHDRLLQRRAESDTRTVG
jgi:hypothetical protein